MQRLKIAIYSLIIVIIYIIILKDINTTYATYLFLKNEALNNTVYFSIFCISSLFATIFLFIAINSILKNLFGYSVGKQRKEITNYQ